MRFRPPGSGTTARGPADRDILATNEERGAQPPSTRASFWQRAYDHVLNNGTVSSIVQFDVCAPKDAGCNASRDKGLHLEILVRRNDQREFDS